ncbi:MAG: HEAT repeat domain-containing protein [Chitinispirillaceae bacterium]|nr:HEAT repeat domain-containing protein [Chitinispirillaceae bacterium]
MKNSEAAAVYEPYIGLRPYTEEHGHMFFGRDAEQAIIIDKILSEKCTMLFAASGVGKSSLLQAGVIPALKDPKKHNLNVVCFKDWVIDPLPVLKKTIETTLKMQNAIDNEYLFDEEYSLRDFIQVCASFSSEPLVILLDQFEEMFQYHRYTKDFNHFLEQIAGALRDKKTNVNFLISMREDFALYMNAFKGHLPTTIFENYYRLEKIDVRKARTVIAWPAEKCGFTYEEGLLDELLVDLADQECQGEVGTKGIRTNVTGSEYVEAPNVQIVCKQIWDIECTNPDKIIRKKTYYENGRAIGFTRSYFNSVISSLTKVELNITSRALTHLVTPRGTKMAYPVSELSHILHIKEKTLQRVLFKLESARVLRCQVRNGAVWYELYHDIFSKIINDWNEKYKVKERNMKIICMTGISLIAVICLFVIVNVFINITNCHLRLNYKIPFSQVELFRGSVSEINFLNIQKFIAETQYTRDHIEPDKIFEKKPLIKHKELNAELIGILPNVSRLKYYVKTGEIDYGLKMVEEIIGGNNDTYKKRILSTLAQSKIMKVHNFLQKHLQDSSGTDVKIAIINAMSCSRSPEATETLIALLNDNNADIVIASINALCLRGEKKAIQQLVNRYNTSDNIDLRIRIAEALAELGSINAVDFLIRIFTDKISQEIRKRVIDALISMKDKHVEITDSMVKQLNSNDHSVRLGAVEMLGKLGGDSAAVSLLKLITERNIDQNTLSASIKALGVLKNEKSVIPVITIMNKRATDYRIRLSALTSLGEIGSEKAIVPLKKIIKETKTDYEILNAAIKGLGSIKTPTAIDLLSGIPGNTKYTMEVRLTAVDVLGKTGKGTSKKVLSALANDNRAEMLLRIKAINALASAVDSVSDLDGIFSACSTLIGKIHDEADGLIERSFSGKTLDSLNKTVLLHERIINLSKYEALIKVSSKKVMTSMCDIVLDKDADHEIRKRAALILYELGNEEDVDLLIKKLKMEHNNLRESIYAACALGALGCEEVLERLIQHLKHPDDLIRIMVIDALGISGGEMAFEPLVALLNNNNNNEIRESIEYALEKIDPSLSFLYTPALCPKIKIRTTSKKVPEMGASEKSVAQLKGEALDTSMLMSRRLKAIRALGTVRSPETGRALIEILKNSSDYYHFTAISALKKTGCSEALSFLQNVLNRENERVSRWRKVRDRATDKFDDSTMEIWREELTFYQPKRALEYELGSAISAIDTSGKQGIELLDHELAAVRAGAQSGLSRQARPQLVKTLYRLRKKNNKNPFFKQSAYGAIDGILSNLELNGNNKELGELRRIKDEIKDTSSVVYSRIGWTIASE